MRNSFLWPALVFISCLAHILLAADTSPAVAWQAQYTIRLNWTLVDTGSSNNTLQLLEANWTDIYSGLDREHTVTNLAPNTFYSFRIVNDSGSAFDVLTTNTYPLPILSLLPSANCAQIVCTNIYPPSTYVLQKGNETSFSEFSNVTNNGTISDPDACGDPVTFYRLEFADPAEVVHFSTAIEFQSQTPDFDCNYFPGFVRCYSYVAINITFFNYTLQVSPFGVEDYAVVKNLTIANWLEEIYGLPTNQTFLFRTCQVGGTCSLPVLVFTDLCYPECGDNQICALSNETATYQCFCESGYTFLTNNQTGNYCQYMYNDCVEANCSSTENCTMQNSGGHTFYMCVPCMVCVPCPPGEAHDPDTEQCVSLCEISPLCSPLANCSVDPTTHERICTCTDGTLGNGLNCSVINGDCGLVNCTTNQTCIHTGNNYTCDCKTGFSLQNGFCLNVNECTENGTICGPNSICTDLIGNYTCDCLPGYVFNGSICELFDCPANFNITCPVYIPSTPSSCKNSPDQCNALTYCPVDTPYACSNSSCVASFLDCPIPACPPSYTQCWDGSCVVDEILCPTVNSCPFLTARCPNGTCVADEDEYELCHLNFPNLCEDGSLPINQTCVPTNGCPARTPFLCPVGTCVDHVESCRMGCKGNEYRCYNGKCEKNIKNCILPPRLARPAPVIYDLPYRANASNPLTIRVFASVLGSVALIAEIDLPRDLLDTDAMARFRLSPVSDSSMYRVTPTGNLHWGNGFNVGVLSTVINISFAADTTLHFDQPITIRFNTTIPPVTHINSLCLGYITQSETWMCESGVKRLPNGMYEASTQQATPTLLSREAPSWPEGVNGMIPVYIVIAILAAYAVGLVYICKYEPKQRRPRRRRRRRNRLRRLRSSRVSMDTLMPDETGEEARESERDTERDTESSGRGSSESDRDEDEKPDLAQLFLGYYTWLGWIGIAVSPLERQNRLTILLCSMFALLFAATLFTGNPNDPYSTATALKRGIIIGVIIFFFSAALTLLFHFSPKRKRKRVFAYGIAILLSVVFVVVTIYISREFIPSQRKTWLVSFAFGLLLDGLVLQPIKILGFYLLTVKTHTCGKVYIYM